MKPTTPCVPTKGASLAVGVCLLLVALPGMSQQLYTDEIKQKLMVPVHLNLGKTTLAAAAQILSAQCGVTIEPAPYLKDRDLVVQIDGVSARTALEALSELNDWAWKETQEKHILISRKVSRLPATPAYIWRRIHAILPRDVHDYLGVEARAENPEEYINPLADSDQQRARKREEDRTRLFRLFKDTQTELYDSLPRTIYAGEPFAYEKMSQSQKNNLLVQTFFPLFSLFLSQGKEFVIGDFRPYVHDPRIAILGLTPGGNLTVGVVFNRPDGQSRAGFEVSLH